MPIEADIAWVSRGEYCEPETVLSLPDDTLLISNVCGFSEPGSGFLTLLGADGQVIKLSIDRTQSVFIAENEFPGANGMEINSGFLYVGGERLWRIDLQSLVVELAAPEWVSDIDGIEFEADGTLQVTPVAGPLIRFPQGQEIQVLAGEGVSSANHGYALRLGLVLIPTGFDNTVIAIRIASELPTAE